MYGKTIVVKYANYLLQYFERTMDSPAKASFKLAWVLDPANLVAYLRREMRTAGLTGALLEIARAKGVTNERDMVRRLKMGTQNCHFN